MIATTTVNNMSSVDLCFFCHLNLELHEGSYHLRAHNILEDRPPLRRSLQKKSRLLNNGQEYDDTNNSEKSFIMSILVVQPSPKILVYTLIVPGSMETKN